MNNFLLLLIVAFTAFSSSSFAQKNAERIFFNGPILTMNDTQPNAEAVAIADEKIVAVGDLNDIMAWKDDSTIVTDLSGKVLMPGIIDPHSHFINGLGMATQVNVSAPPVGPAKSPADIVTELRRYVDMRKIPPGKIVMGYGYDENLMPGGSLLTRWDLDVEFPNHPVLVMHVSLHGAVLNSAALKKFGIDADTETVPGGVIVRQKDTGEPEGLIMETSFLPIFEGLPTPTPEQEMVQLKFAQELYASNGITTANEGATHAGSLKILQRGAKAGALFIDVIAHPFITDLDPILLDNPPEMWGDYINGLKLGGCKITLDGSPQGKTAWFTTPYLVPGPSGEKNWSGEPGFSTNIAKNMLKSCYKAGIQAFVHANGDAAIDLLIQAHEEVSAELGLDPARDHRTTVIHAQFIRPDQIKKFVENKIIPSFYTEHTFFFSGAHITQRGPKQASYISPMADALAAGLLPTNHTDFNVVPIDHMLVVWSAVTRKDRDGNVIGPDQRITALDALKAITINAAFQFREEEHKGSIENGKIADLVILSEDPTSVDPDDIQDIKVIETIKKGNTIFLSKL